VLETGLGNLVYNVLSWCDRFPRVYTV